jgi:predicted alpha/beta-hydrolase family hydrolase
MQARELELQVDDTIRVSAVLDLPTDPRALLLLAHGAGAGMRHAFMEQISARLATRGLAVLRYNFPYMEAGRRGPDSPKRLLATVSAALELARRQAQELGSGEALPLYAGGKSMGGRMTTQLAAQGGEAVSQLAGVVLFGFPLHAAGRPDDARGQHLGAVSAPMLFIQGTRDKLAESRLLEPLLASIAHATLHSVEGADHGFHVLKRSGRNDDEVLDELATRTASWIGSLA